VKGALTSSDEQLVQHIVRLREELRVAFDPLIRCIRLIVIEGPARVAEAAEALNQSVITANRALHPLLIISE
jgi:predicted transcriptional regulator